MFRIVRKLTISLLQMNNRKTVNKSRLYVCNICHAVLQLSAVSIDSRKGDTEVLKSTRQIRVEHAYWMVLLVRLPRNKTPECSNIYSKVATYCIYNKIYLKNEKKNTHYI
jgi:hypothetical protein